MGRLPATATTNGLVIDPTRPKRVYAASDAGVFRSDDAGEIWQTAARGLPPGGVRALALDPRQPQRLYALTSSAALYQSTDGADSWQALAGAGR